MLDEVWINAGFYWLGRRIFDYLPESGSIEKDVFPKLAGLGSLGFFGFQVQGKFWRSIDTIKDFEEASSRFPRASGI
jgi:NDP-sugar pyrophosphorylase family protein